jgi:hypothetical protein
MRGEPQVSRTPLMACVWALAALLAWPAVGAGVYGGIGAGLRF